MCVELVNMHLRHVVCIENEESSGSCDDDMNSSCVEVSQILLSLEDAALHSNKLSSPLGRYKAHDFDDVLAYNESQSTVDGHDTLNDRTNDHDRQVVDADETQYVEHCYTAGLGRPVLTVGLDHAYAYQSVDETENSDVTASVDNSPSVLGTTRLLQLMCCNDSALQMSSCTVGMNAAGIDTIIQPCDIGVLGTVSAAAVCGVNQASVSLLSSNDEHYTGLCGGCGPAAAAGDTPVDVQLSQDLIIEPCDTGVLGTVSAAAVCGVKQACSVSLLSSNDEHYAELCGGCGPDADDTPVDAVIQPYNTGVLGTVSAAPVCGVGSNDELCGGCGPDAVSVNDAVSVHGISDDALRLPSVSYTASLQVGLFTAVSVSVIKHIV